jgi:hypothetical protein
MFNEVALFLQAAGNVGRGLGVVFDNQDAHEILR